MTKSSDLLLAFSNEKHRNPHIKIGIGLHVLFYYEVLLLKLIFTKDSWSIDERRL